MDGSRARPPREGRRADVVATDPVPGYTSAMAELGRRLPGLACVGLVVLAVVAALATYRDYGVTWDEGVQAHYGELVVAYFRSGLADEGAKDFLDLHYYGPLFEALAALAYASEPARRFEIRHLCIALAGLLTLPALMAYARAFGLCWVPLAAGLALATLPRFWGHLFNNSKDVPFAAGFAACMALLAGLLARPGLPWPHVLATGAAIGVTAAIRPGGLPLLAALLAAVLAAAVWRRPGDARARLRAAPAALGRGAAALALAWTLLVAAWPWAHEAPLRRPLEAMGQAVAFEQVYPVLFDGRYLASDELPASYLPRFLLISTPPPVLVLAALGLVWAIRAQVRGPHATRSWLLGLTQLWLFAPLAFFVVARPNAYDGLRHFLFVLPALALFAALGARWLVVRAPAGRGRALALAAVALALAWPVAHLVRLHPYQATYFNGLVGGLAGAEGRYETDYWTASYKEAMEWINARAAERPAGRLRVLVAANAYSLPCAETFASDRVELDSIFRTGLGGSLPEGFDYYVATYRYGQRYNFPRAPVVHTIGREGAVFTVIKGRR